MTGIKILQTNLGRTRAAHDLAYANCKQCGIDLLIMSEPNKNRVKGSDWIKDKREDTAVLWVNRSLVLVSSEPGEGYLALNLKLHDLELLHNLHFAKHQC